VSLLYAVSSVSHKMIDKTNILKASIRSMHLSLSKLSQQPGLLLIDGNRFTKYKRIPHKCIVKGDATYSSIAAASILAKTYRDELMMKLHNEFPWYKWDTNKGYGTVAHRKAIEEFGLCTYHRKSFKLLPRDQALF
jgi:ribonuclease HII